MASIPIYGFLFYTVCVYKIHLQAYSGSLPTTSKQNYAFDRQLLALTIIYIMNTKQLFKLWTEAKAKVAYIQYRQCSTLELKNLQKLFPTSFLRNEYEFRRLKILYQSVAMKCILNCKIHNEPKKNALTIFEEGFDKKMLQRMWTRYPWQETDKLALLQPAMWPAYIYKQHIQEYIPARDYVYAKYTRIYLHI